MWVYAPSIMEHPAAIEPRRYASVRELGWVDSVNNQEASQPFLDLDRVSSEQTILLRVHIGVQYGTGTLSGRLPAPARMQVS